MKSGKIVRREFLGIVENQIRDGKPAETKETFQRLVKSGYSEKDAKKYIALCVAVEIFDVMKYHRPFNEKRFVQNLLNLPNQPAE